MSHPKFRREDNNKKQKTVNMRIYVNYCNNWHAMVSHCVWPQKRHFVFLCNFDQIQYFLGRRFFSQNIEGNAMFKGEESWKKRYSSGYRHVYQRPFPLFKPFSTLVACWWTRPPASNDFSHRPRFHAGIKVTRDNKVRQRAEKKGTTC